MIPSLVGYSVADAIGLMVEVAHGYGSGADMPLAHK